MKINVNQIGIDHIEEHIKDGKPTFLSPLSPVYKETVKAAAILNELIGEEEDRKTFFCNSHMEGLHGALKLARHYNYDNQKSPLCVILDDSGYYKEYFSPSGEQMVPGIFFAETTDQLNEIVKKEEIGILVLSYHPQLNEDYTESVFSHFKGVKILDYARVSINDFKQHIREVARGWDIVVWGEALTQNQIPVGGFSARTSVYKPWDNYENCLLHSSTYAGNGMVTSLIVKTLEGYFPEVLKKGRLKGILDQVEGSIRGKNKYTKRFINSSIIGVHESMNLNLDVYLADTNRLKIKDKNGRKNEVFDCVGGGGCNVLGHNPSSLFQKVKSKYEEDSIDHVRNLELKLQKVTGLDHLFMGVSGASVVEIGMTLSRIANPKRKKIVAFTGNYAGKTLIAMNGTYTGIKSYFEPLYNDIILINPFSNGATAYLKEVFEEGEVGLVWFEHIQGGQLLNIAPTLLSFLTKNKEKYGYFIGVDEILQGVYRTGNFFSFDSELLKPDIVTFSKGLSGMIYPVAATMISRRVVDDARRNSPRDVERLSEMYSNNFAACIAEQLLDECEELELSEKVKHYSEIIQKRTAHLVGKEKSFSRVEIRGFHIRFDLNTKKFPFKNFDLPDRNKALTKLFLKHKILSFQGRLLLPLNLSEEEINQFIDNLEKIAQTNLLGHAKILYGMKYKKGFTKLYKTRQ